MLYGIMEVTEISNNLTSFPLCYNQANVAYQLIDKLQWLHVNEVFVYTLK